MKRPRELLASPPESVSPSVLERRSLESELLFRALASEVRLRILALLAGGPRNISELGQALGASDPSVSRHIQALEQAGLVSSEYLPGAQGTQKRCRLRYSGIHISLEAPESAGSRVEQVEMPVGLFTNVAPLPTCGLASTEQLIGLLDDPQSFLLPERAAAQLLWMGAGFVEYTFPNRLLPTVEVERLELAMEICSEAPGHNPDYPSDLTLWVNDIEVGTWTSPGDFGGTHGRHNPAWWQSEQTQHGMLKTWSVTLDGAFIDGVRLSDVTLADLRILPRQPILVRIGNRPDAEHVGGLNLFGRGFGNYREDPTLRLFYPGGPETPHASPDAPGQRAEPPPAPLLSPS